MRRQLGSSDESFPQDVLELEAYFAPVQPGQAVRAVPGAGMNVPIWLLGSSLFSAKLAAALGLRFAFASHFAPAHLRRALDVYRTQFKPSALLKAPYAMAVANVFAAETDAEARRLFTSLQQQFGATAQICDHAARPRSFEILADARDALAAERAAQTAQT